MIVHGGNSFLVSTMSAAIVTTSGFYTVTDNFTAAMLTFGSQRVNGALEAVEIMGDPVYQDLEAFFILIAANFASLHRPFLRFWSGTSVAALAFTSALHHAVLLGIFGAFLDEFFGERLLVRCRDDRNLA